VFVQHSKQAEANHSAATSEVRFITEALATQAKVTFELEAKHAKEAAEKQIADDLKKQQLVDEEGRQQEENSCRKRKCEAVEGANVQAGLPFNTKAQKTQDIVMGSVLDGKCQILLRGQASSQSVLLLKNTTDTNKTLSKDTILLIFAQGTAVSLGSDCDFEWRMNLKTDIVCKSSKTRMRLDRYLKEHPDTNEVFRHEPWTAGTLPKALVMKPNEDTMKFLCKSPKSAHVYAVVSAAQVSSLCSLLWMVTFADDNKKRRLEPCGVAVVLNKTLTIPGHGEESLGT
jgi:hypothetical protein